MSARMPRGQRRATAPLSGEPRVPKGRYELKRARAHFVADELIRTARRLRSGRRIRTGNSAAARQNSRNARFASYVAAVSGASSGRRRRQDVVVLGCVDRGLLEASVPRVRRTVHIYIDTAEDDELHRYPTAAAGRGAAARVGRNAASSPSTGRNEHSLNTYCTPVMSATCPSSAAPMPPSPNAKPKNRPATVPTRNGTSS